MREVVSASFTLVQGVAHEFVAMRDMLAHRMRHLDPVHRGRWQSADVSGMDSYATHEISNVIFIVGIPGTVTNLQEFYKPDLPWAENHFQERVGREPVNPAPSYLDWPYHSAGQADLFAPDGKFDHTYPERMWPKQAGGKWDRMSNDLWFQEPDNVGIRFGYGDLGDVAALLAKDPMTRQAYLPIWFPEDTGAVDGQRVPCTLGYHFIRRGANLDCHYYIRSCDVFRHFTNDAYMAARLCQWIVEQLNGIVGRDDGQVWCGNLIMHISNLHLLKGDAWRINP